MQLFRRLNRANRNACTASNGHQPPHRSARDKMAFFHFVLKYLFQVIKVVFSAFVCHRGSLKGRDVLVTYDTCFPCHGIHFPTNQLESWLNARRSHVQKVHCRCICRYMEKTCARSAQSMSAALGGRFCALNLYHSHHYCNDQPFKTHTTMPRLR